MIEDRDRSDPRQARRDRALARFARKLVREWVRQGMTATDALGALAEHIEAE